MPLSIKSIRVEQLAREISERTGESLTSTIQKALEEYLKQLKHQRRKPFIQSQLEEVLYRMDRLPIQDSRAPDEIMGYDEHGIPR